MPENINILIVDDIQTDLLVLQSALANETASIVVASSGPDALDLALKNHFHLILVSTHMPGVQGFEVAERFRENEKTCRIPIIFIAEGEAEGPHGFIGYEKSVVDYLFRPLDPGVVRDKVHIFAQWFRHQKQLQTTNAELSRKVARLESVNREIQDHQASAIEEARLKALLELAGTAAHELNQPLMALMGYIQLMSMDGDIPPHLKDRIQKIDATACRIADTVKKIQDLRYPPPVSPHPGGKTLLNLDQRTFILYLEENDADFKTIRDILASHKKIRIQRARSIQDVFSVWEKEPFDLLLIDYLLNDEAGLQLLETLTQQEAQIPVVAITHQADMKAARIFIQVGGSDYLAKSELNEKLLLRVISHAMEKSRLKHEIRAIKAELSATTVRDTLTGMFNRRYFQEILEREIFIANRYGHELSLCLIDIDHLRKVNRVHGYPCGDRVVQAFSRLLSTHIRKYDVVCRYGGGTFAVILPDIPLEKAILRCQDFRDQVAQHEFVCREGQSVFLTTSIGIAAITEIGITTDQQLTAQAEKALCQAKAAGKSGVVVMPDTEKPAENQQKG
ncbi:diguanylate cyclase [Desulfosarcina sp. OttesenSCG-928-B08]|nr:diguanylate cyclase [Desulfosarcina sp. OttesenSCG-928-B08]